MTNTPATTKTKAKLSPSRYLEGVGRRKTAVARVRLTQGAGEVKVNDRKLTDYFQASQQQKKVLSPFEAAALEAKKFNLSVHVVGGGVNAQAEAVRHGLARAIVIFQEDTKKKLREAGYLTRDSRMVERKHYGKKKARRSPQWSKR